MGKKTEYTELQDAKAKLEEVKNKLKTNRDR
jgi:hypothetical protein